MTEEQTTDATDKEQRRQAQLDRARRKYRERFKKTRKRIYGTLSNEEYAKIEARAEEAGRAVWSQIHAEAEAYASGEYLPSKEISEQIRELNIQLRRIGTNINQITREFHTEGVHDEPEMLRNLKELEFYVREFVKHPWADPAANEDDKT